MPANQSTPEVTRADRDLAHEIMHHVRGYAVKLPDDRHWLIDLVARHRLTHSRTRGGDELREAVKLTIADASYHLRKYRPHCLEALEAALASTDMAGAGEVEQLRKVARMVVEASDLAGFSGPLGDAARAALSAPPVEVLTSGEGIGALLDQFQKAVRDAEFRRPRGPRSGDHAYYATLCENADELKRQIIAAASPKATATASVREGQWRCKGCGWVGKDAIGMDHPQNGCDLELMRFHPATLTDSGTAATIGGERA